MKKLLFFFLVCNSIVGQIKKRDSIEELEEIVLKNKVKNTGAKVVSGQIIFDEEYINNAPVTLGEKDIIKILQQTPGVQSGSEGQSGLLVRGGNQGMNLMYIDGVYLHNSSHLGGLFSLINSDFVQKLTFSKTSFDASFGGRISSITEIKTKNNFDKFFLKGSLGLVTSKVTTGVNLDKINTKVLLSGRRTYLDLIQPIFESSLKSENENSALGKGKTYFFYDYLIKTTTKINHNQELNFIYYNTTDSYTDTGGIDVSSSSWKNKIYGLNWKVRFNNYFRNELYLSKSNYDLGFKGVFFPIKFNLQSKYNQFEIKNQILINKKGHFVKLGLDLKKVNNLPKRFTASQGEVNYDIPNQEEYKYSFISVFIDDKFKLSDNIKLKIGLRQTVFILDKSQVFNHYIDSKFEPRISVNYQFKENQYLKFSYQDVYQFIHQSQIASYSTPLDFFLPSQKQLKPQRGIQYSFSYARDFEKINFDITTYYKKIKNYSEFINGSVNTLFLENIYDDLVLGNLFSKGIEFSVNYKLNNKLEGSANYTFSRTFAKFNQLNKGDKFPVIFDRPHNLNLSLSYQLTKKIKTGLNFIYTSGQNLTPPKDIRIVEEVPVITFKERNSVRYPSYHRMDVYALYNLKKTKKYTSDLSLSLYNIYNRQNPFFIEYKVGNFEESVEGVRTEVETLFPFVPSINWSFSFK